MIRAFLPVTLLWALISGLALTGCKRVSTDDRVQVLEQRVHQLEKHECGGRP